MLPTKSRARCFLGFMLLVAVELQAAGVPDYRPFAVEDSRYLAELVRWERYGPGYGAVRFRFRLVDKQSDEEKLFDVDNATTSLEHGEIAGGKLALFGDVQGLATGITLIDLHHGRVEDFFLSYGGDLSPDGRTLAYVNFYPRRSPPEAQSDLVLGVDLEASPPDGTERKRHPVYPLESVIGEGRALAWVEDPSQRHFLLKQAGMLWLDDPRRLIFLDAVEESIWLVEVDLSRGLSEPRARRRIVNVAEILKPPPDSEGYRRLLEQESASLSAIGLRQQDGKVVVELSRQRVQEGVFRVTQFAIDLPSAEAVGESLPGEEPR